MTSPPEAIVIGAGHNGLACACHLARAGLRVLVVEASAQIGGMTRSAEMTLPGFRYDVHAAGYQLANLSPSPGELGLAGRGFELLFPPINYAHAFPDGRSILFHRDLEATCASIAGFSERDAEAWRRIMSEYHAGKEQLCEALFRPPAPGEPRRRTVRAWCGEHFESEAVRTSFAAWALHLALGPDDPGSVAGADFAPLIQDVGNNPVKGGMQQLPDALASHLLDHGGEIRTGARVERIRTAHRRALGVTLTGGEEIDATRLVAASANPVGVALDLLGEEVVGAEIAGKLRALYDGLATMTLWLALDGPLEVAAGDFAGQTLYTHCSGPSLDFLARATAQARRGWLPEAPLFQVVNESGVDPCRAPAGRAALRILAMPLPFEIRGDATGVVPQRDWEAAREPYADHLLARLERDFAPGLRGRILARTVHDPVTMSRESPDAIRGCITHVACSPDQMGAMRPIPELGGYRTPVANVYLCGSGSHPGAGVSMAPGRNAALRICEDLGLPFAGGGPDRRGPRLSSSGS